MTDFKTLFTQYCAIAYDKQLLLADMLEGAGDWQLQLPTGKLKFASGLVMDVQLLGTEALPEAAWLWAWSNATDVLPDDMLSVATLIRIFGTEHAIEELTEPLINIDERRNGHHFAMLSMMLSETFGYYRAPFDGGALFLLIINPNLPVPEVKPIERVATVFPQMIQNIRIENHKQAFIHYLEAYNMQIKDTETAVFGLHESDETRIHAEFDDQQRLSKLTTVMK